MGVIQDGAFFPHRCRTRELIMMIMDTLRRCFVMQTLPFVAALAACGCGGAPVGPPSAPNILIKGSPGMTGYGITYFDKDGGNNTSPAAR